MSSAASNEVYDAFLSRKNGFLVGEAEKLLAQMTADVGKGLQPLISTGQKHCEHAFIIRAAIGMRPCALTHHVYA